MKDDSSGYSEDIINVLRGLCMGVADIIPGVSGGTVALILGHYERLIAAIANVNRRFLAQLLSGKFSAALSQIDFRFLLALGVGIASGIIGFATLIHYLITHHQAYVYALFTGMILASSHLVAGRMKAWSVGRVVLMVVGGMVAWQICLLTPMHGQLNHVTAFLAATVAICAMILPGISGAFVLLLLGLYHPITELLRGLPKGDVSLYGLSIIAVFCLGCLVGLLAFSRLLRWLLAHRHDSTMAFLVGLMLGSLYKIWPFQRVTDQTAGLPFKEQQFEWVLPSESAASPLVVLAAAVTGAGVTLLMEYVGSRLAQQKPTGSTE